MNTINTVLLVIFMTLIAVMILDTLDRVEEINQSAFKQIRDQQDEIRTLKFKLELVEGVAAKDIIHSGSMFLPDENTIWSYK